MLQPELKFRRDKIRSLMVSQGIDAALITCNANLIYTYGCVVSGYLYLPLHSPALLFFKRPNNITGFMYQRKICCNRRRGVLYSFRERHQLVRTRSNNRRIRKCYYSKFKWHLCCTLINHYLFLAFNKNLSNLLKSAGLSSGSFCISPFLGSIREGRAFANNFLNPRLLFALDDL